MIVAKQKNIRVFEIHVEDKGEFLDYINKNLILLKRFTLLLSGDIDKEICDFLNVKELTFGTLNSTLAQEEQLKITPEEKKTVKINIEAAKVEQIDLEESLVLEKTIRSGEMIDVENDLLIFGRINSGATVICKKNTIIRGEIDGKVLCDGNFAFVESFGSGSLSFHGEIFDRENVTNKNVMIYKNDGKIEVKECSKER